MENKQLSQLAMEGGSAAAPMEGQNGRMVKLTGALNIALDKSLRPVTFQAFSSCFPQHLVDANPQLFMAAHQNYIDILRTNIEVDLCEFDFWINQQI